MRVLIMAAGSSTRWQASIPGKKGIATQKLLAQLPGNETVLGRQLRQFKERGFDPIIVSNDDELKSAFKHARFFTPSDASCLAATILSTTALWRDEILLTFGDVVFSPAAFAKLFDPVKGLRVYGFAGDRKRWSEIYAWRFGEESFRAFKKCPERPDQSRGQEGQANLYPSDLRPDSQGTEGLAPKLGLLDGHHRLDF